MTPRALRVLVLEDSGADADLMAQALQRAGIQYETRRVDTEAAFGQALGQFAPDVVLSDHALAQFNALAALQALRASRPGTPLIVVSGSASEDQVVQCLTAGAEDYILKDRLARLAPAVERAVAMRRPLDRLTPRQREVLRLLAQGHATRDIARQLNLSVKTIETHRAEVMRRLDIHDVASLVRFAVRVRLVTSDA